MSSKTESAGRVIIITAIDRTAASDPVLDAAVSLAQVIPRSELHVLHVIPFEPVPEGTTISVTEMMELGRVFIDAATRRVAERFTGRICGHLAMGSAQRRILQLAADLEADFIIVGSHGKKALERLLLGSVSDAIVKKAQCSVIVVRQKEYASSDVPEIDPPCTDCLTAQRESNGERLWCERHSARHAHGRLHYETPAPFATGSTFLRPES